jgi:hypothetical protein
MSCIFPLLTINSFIYEFFFLILFKRHIEAHLQDSVGSTEIVQIVPDELVSEKRVESIVMWHRFGIQVQN